MTVITRTSNVTKYVTAITGSRDVMGILAMGRRLPMLMVVVSADEAMKLPTMPT